MAMRIKSLRYTDEGGVIFMKATLVLENGSVWHGRAIGAHRECICEMVFDTGMVGYQEALSDPSFAGLGVVMSYPLVGNTGVNSEDDESRTVWAEALIVRKLTARGSNFRCEGTLDDYLVRHGIPGIEGVDTRAITRLLRSEGPMNGMISIGEDLPQMDEALERIKAHRSVGAVARVTRREPETFDAQGGEVARVAVLDYGAKRGMIEQLTRRGCCVTALPASTPASEIIGGGFDGVLLSNGPGDPMDIPDVVGEARKIYESKLPIFGICLGHQILAIAAGARTTKMRFGHRGANHPVREAETGRTFITSQNHGYCVDKTSVDPSVARISYENVNDGSIEGLVYSRPKCSTVQFHPEGSPGPMDTEHLFDEFVKTIGGDR